MSARDFMPFTSPKGGDTLRSAYPSDAGTIAQGEPVVLSGGGGLTLSGNNPAAVLGVAAQPSTVANTRVTVYKPTEDSLFITRNFATDGAGTLTTPTQANIGRQGGFFLSGARWVLDTGPGINLIVEVENVLDSAGRPAAHPGFTTGEAVIFRFLAR